MNHVWLPEYSVGHPLLDEQHKGFFVLCSQAAACCSDRSLAGIERLHELLNELALYANRHFLTEESMLAGTSYPDLDGHKAEHERYRERLTEILLEATFNDPNSAHLYDYLTRWWTEHILQSDMKYRDYVIPLATR